MDWAAESTAAPFDAAVLAGLHLTVHVQNSLLKAIFNRDVDSEIELGNI